MICGSGTIFDEDSYQCVCRDDYTPNDNELYIAGLLNTDAYQYGEDIFDFTVSLINNKFDGWFDDLLSTSSMTVKSTFLNTKCDETTAATSYWHLKTNWTYPLQGVIGCSCSGASKAVARIAGLQKVPLISPSSSSAELSDAEAYPTFSRMVAPDNQEGQVGALVALMENFGWSRVGLLTTDTAYGSDMATEFANSWKKISTHEIAYQLTVDLTAAGEIDEMSLLHTLDAIPTGEPRINSRVILLFAHNKHAQDIIRLATKQNFQPDTIWIGSDSWTGRPFDPSSMEWMPETPGYIGLVPYSNLDGFRRKQFMDAFRQYQEFMNRPVPTETEMNHYVYEVVPDAIVTMIKALSRLSPQDRMNGTKVTNMIRTGVTISERLNGDIRFTSNGDRAHPLYSVMHLRDKFLPWESVGVVGTHEQDSNIRIGNICWPSNGCQLQNAPTEKYPIPNAPLPVWVLVLIPIISVLMIILGFRYYRTHSKKKHLRRDMTSLQEKMEKMKNIDSDLTSLQDQLEKAKRKQKSLILKRADLQENPETWTEGSTTILNEVDPSDDQYLAVEKQLKESMSDAWISKLWRVQNESLWTFYSFHKDKLTMNGIQHSEKSVWHGTSSLDPGVIFNDTQDGFMMQFSRQGFWGRGIYFAKNSSYSYSYSYTPSSQCMDREDAVTGEREMFLAKLLVGNEIYMNRDESPDMQRKCKELTVPPINPTTGLKYNTVSGHTGGSQVWIVYENGRAYPDYLVRYYRGDRDPKRTPFRSSSSSKKEPEGKLTSSINTVKTFLSASISSSSTSSPPKKVTWEYLDGVWKEYPPQAQTEIENFFQLRQKNSNVIRIKSGQWSYQVDVVLMTQTNVEHANRTSRQIRRRLS